MFWTPLFQITVIHYTANNTYEKNKKTNQKKKQRLLQQKRLKKLKIKILEHNLLFKSRLQYIKAILNSNKITHVKLLEVLSKF